MKGLVAPPYGKGPLAEVVPSLLAGFGVPGMTDVLGIAGPTPVCLLLVDGLGWQLLRDHREDAPFLASAAGGPISAGFPATTATSIASLATGVAGGEHGVVGYSFAVDGELLNALRWHRHGVAESVDLRSVLVPEEVQPRPTAFERAARAGVDVRFVVPREQRGSGLSRAVLRGGVVHPVLGLGDLVARTVEALGERTFCYTYHADLDTLGHVYGPGSEPWRHQLRFVDRLAELLADNLPRGGALVVTADHGMVEAGDRIDFDTEPALRDGVRLLGGEARVRHVYTDAPDDVRVRWDEVLGERAVVLGREEAIAAGWFGPRVAAHVRDRIGDLVVAMRGTAVVVRSEVEGRLSALVGHHGSLTEAEQLVPLLVSTGSV
ncbi:alkaline phosphatase family protein [Saccharothrix variisporea]|uniref:Type I phosphodiesterase/nucleotide pyrophosphatase n=1 Tax=Saccharothrix variisporea TaxID=543527 RepID=A0A495X1F8_9PSEU|nr:nucleotide pyrophosphatase/phosphodiesterase family protein [Saccharothrix variisporea]RKT67802.1 type I phosphodiesterase/nucleotide pyrophosphatase [Saccharothrix variisporea]